MFFLVVIYYKGSRPIIVDYIFTPSLGSIAVDSYSVAVLF